jgi:DNA repair exonuclease SbcCD ATPase subunit
MKLEEVWIDRYGPLQKKMDLGDRLHVIQGPNESGKSLLVEALLKKFADGAVSNPRIEESPEGFVVVSDGSGEHKIGDGESLISYYEELYSREVSSEELRNIFVIRNGDVRIDDEDEFYSRVTDKVTGRRTKDIQRIRDELLDEGRLTPGRQNISNSQGHNKAKDQLDKAESLKEDVEDYVQNNEDVQSTEARLFEAKREKKRLEQKVDRLKEAEKVAEYEDLVKEKDEAEKNLRELKNLPDKDEVSELERRAEGLNERAGERDELSDKKEDQLRLAKLSVGGSAATFVLFLVGVALEASLLSTLGVVLPLGLLGYAVLMYRNWNETSNRLSEFNTEQERLLSDANKAGLSAEDISSLRKEISDIKKERGEYEKELNQRIGVLKQELGIDRDSSDKVVEEAEEKLEEREEELVSVDEEFSESELNQARGDLKDLSNSITEMENDLEEHGNKLLEFSKRAHQLKFDIFTGQELDLEINNLDALESLIGSLDEFIHSIEKDAEVSREAYEIFGEMEEIERQETADLFEEGSRATELFREVTDDRYETVTYDSENNEVLVKRSTDETFTPSQLSDGTRDQLYFSIRVALGEEILQDDAGFFVLDDAFLTSDPERLGKQAEMLEKLMDDGWQIVYLTSKDGTVSTLSELNDSEVIELERFE